MKDIQLTSSRSVGMRDINAILVSAPISRIKTLRDDAGCRGFTLIELLIVVLIIGVLSAIALPQYQKAVLKSRYSAMMPLAKAVAEGNEVYYMEHGNYSTDATQLDIAGLNENYSDNTKLDLKHNNKYSYVMASNNTSIPHNNYIVYQKHSENFPDNIHCEAYSADEKAKWVCESLGGKILSTGGSQTENFLTYILKGNESDGTFEPTFAEKAEKLCEGMTECDIDEDAQTVITRQCGTTSFTFGDGTTANVPGIVQTKYDAAGNPTTTTTICEDANAHSTRIGSGRLTGCTCSDNTSLYGRMITTVDENGTILSQIRSFYPTLSGDTQTMISTLREDGTYFTKMRKCENDAAIDIETGVCPNNAYYAKADYVSSMPVPSFPDYEFGCETISSQTGDCEKYDLVLKYNRPSAGSPYHVKMRCSEFTDDGSCTGTWTYNDQYCPNGYDKTTYQCK